MVRPLAVSSMFLALGCGSTGGREGTDGSGASGGVGAVAEPGKAFSATVDGTQVDFTDALQIYAGGGLLAVDGSPDRVELTLIMPFTATPATHSCDPRDYSPKAIVLSDRVNAYETSRDGGVCTITVETTDQMPGGRVAGTFSGTLLAAASTKVITNGRFDALVT